MKLDPAKYPGSTPGSQGNYNNRTRTYQVFPEGQFRSPLQDPSTVHWKIDREGKIFLQPKTTFSNKKLPTY